MPGFEQAQVLILSSIDWGAAWQRHQIFAWQFAQAGHEVFFVENSGFRDPGLRDLGRLWSRLKRACSPSHAAAQDRLPSNLHVIAPRLLPPTRALFRMTNRSVLIPSLRKALKAAGLGPRPLIITYFPTATTSELIRQVGPAAVVYDCASNFRAHPQAPTDFPRLEADLLSRADLVVCDSDFLYQQKRAEHKKVVQIHQGVPEEFFKAKPAAEGFRRVCYYGTWGQDTDPAFLAALQEAGFEVTVSGFLKGSPPPVLPPGVRHLPPVRREDLVARLEDFDVFLLPYRINPFLMGVIPAKIYEILAMGRPVLATPLPSFAPLSHLVHVAGTPSEWVRIAKGLSRTETPALRDQRIALAREHTYGREFERFREAARSVWGGS